MNRREMVLAVIALSAAPFTVLAQQSGKVWRIGFLYVRSRPTPTSPDVYLDAFVRGMRDLGYVEGKNLVIEWRFADGHNERLPRLAAQLAQMNVDVIVTHSIFTTQAAQRETSTIPIVFTGLTDPVIAGVVKSLARPEWNLTGLSLMSVDSSPKHVDLLAVTIPKLTRIAFLMNPIMPTHPPMLKSTQEAAQRIGATVLPVEARNPEEIERGFLTMAGWHAEALIVAADPIFLRQQRQLVQLALKHHIPTMFPYRQDTEAGGLMSYGQDLADFYRLAARYVDKIFKGAKPGDLPVEQPTIFEFVVNLKTAKMLGLKIPQSLLLRADRVIE
jgi:putative ABC transport system substrate-binding protein